MRPILGGNVRHILLALALSSLQATAPSSFAQAQETLQLQTFCPPSGPIACLTAELNWTDDGSGRISQTPLEGYDAVTEAGPIRQSVLLSGRLNDGPSRPFRLSYRREDDGHTPLWNIGSAAFLGRSSANRPVVLTNRGPLEILTPAIDVAYGNTFMVADERTWKLKAPFVELAGGGYHAAAPDDIGVWDKRRNVCIEAPTRSPGMLKLRKDGCGNGKVPPLEPANITLANMRKLIPYTHIGPETDENNLDVRRSEFGGEGAYYSIYRIRGTHTLIIVAMYDHC